MPSTFFILAGEASGDLHAAKLMQAIRARDPQARFVGMGGKAMAAAGLDVAKDLDGMQVVGFWEVAKRYGFFVRVGDQLLDRIKHERPAALICVDYPGFNLRFAERVKKLGIPVIYYIVPQVWAWKPQRAKKMARLVDQAFCVFEFEPPFFEKFGLKTTFVGHPLVDRAPGHVPPKLELNHDRKTVALLPGSRSGEFNEHVLPMCEGFNQAQRKLKNLRGLLSLQKGITARHTIQPQAEEFVVTSNAPRTLAESAIALTPAENSAQSAIDKASGANSGHAALLPSATDFSVVKSGTSTLEAGLAGNPLCVLYRGSWASYAIAHQLVNIPVFSLVNIVLGRYAVPELLQDDVNPARIAHEIERGLTDEKYRAQQQAALAELPKKLGGPGASDRAALGILNFVGGRS
jgi:lipid-A-disaccharide synthase